MENTLKNRMLEIENLNFYIKKNLILKNINVSIEKNKIIALLGETKSGKTTLLRCINKTALFIEKSKIEGTIKINGNNIFENHLNKACYIVERPYIFPCSIMKNILIGLNIKNIKDKNIVSMQIERYLKEVDLWEDVKYKLNNNADRLNFFQQQKLCLARGLAMKPLLILADNPTKYFDYESIIEFEKLLLKLKKNYTIILIPRNISQVRRISDEIIFMSDGKIIEKGPTTKLLEDPETEVLRKFLYINS